MKDQIVNSGKWIKDLKWWQLLILFPTVFTILFSTGSKGFDLIYYELLGKPKLGKLEKQNLLLFQKHFSEKPTVKKTLQINSGIIEVAYYKSDGATLVTRRFDNGRILMKWLPYEQEEIKFGKSEFSFSSTAHACEHEHAKTNNILGVHAQDHNFVETDIGWTNYPYEFMRERLYLRDKCFGRYKVWAPTGQTCCWKWIVYKHRRQK